MVLDCLFAPETVFERAGAGEVEFRVRIDGVSALRDEVAEESGGGSRKGNEEVGIPLNTAWLVGLNGCDIGSGGTGICGMTGFIYMASLDLRIKLRYGEDPMRLIPALGSCELLH